MFEKRTLLCLGIVTTPTRASPRAPWIALPTERAFSLPARTRERTAPSGRCRSFQTGVCFSKLMVTCFAADQVAPMLYPVHEMVPPTSSSPSSPSMANRWTEGPSTIDAANCQRQEQLPWKPLLDLNVGDACPHAHVALNVLRGWTRVVDRRKGTCWNHASRNWACSSFSMAAASFTSFAQPRTRRRGGAWQWPAFRELP